MSCGSVKSLILALALTIPLLSGPAWGAGDSVYVPNIARSQTGSAAQGDLSTGAPQEFELKDCHNGIVTEYGISEKYPDQCIFNVGCSNGAKKFNAALNTPICPTAQHAKAIHREVRVTHYPGPYEGYQGYMTAVFIWIEQAPPNPDADWL